MLAAGPRSKPAKSALPEAGPAGPGRPSSTGVEGQPFWHLGECWIRAQRANDPNGTKGTWNKQVDILTSLPYTEIDSRHRMYSNMVSTMLSIIPYQYLILIPHWNSHVIGFNRSPTPKMPGPETRQVVAEPEVT